MKGNMMHVPMTIPFILERVRTIYREREVISLVIGGRNEAGQPVPKRHTIKYGELADRALRLGAGLLSLGLQPGDRVATLAVNSFRHLEAYLGVPSAGLVLHTVNIRLHPEQVAWILNHAEDRVLLIENAFAAMIPALKAACPKLEKILVLGPLPQAIPGVEDYDTFVMSHEPMSRDPELDENDAAGMCYTSGTTGNPKGVMYTHRSTILHSLASAPKDALNVGESDTVLPIVPMFHVNAWGLPYTCAMFGARQAFTGAFTDGPTLAQFMQDEGVTTTAGVPTIWMGLLGELNRARDAGTPYDLSLIERMIVGGSAAPESLIRAFDSHGLNMVQAWGMTETHPLGTASSVPPGVDPRSDEGYTLRAKQGRAVPLVELEILSDDGQRLPHDGKTMGRLMARGPWIADSYFKGEGENSFMTLDDGQLWFDTGDISTLDERGYMHIQDRSKDLIKSGGEWISSVDLENAIMGHPAVAQCAVIAMDDPKWDERPLAVIVPRPGQAVTHAEITEFLAPRFAKWWLPDAVALTDSLPIGATGKFLKRELREEYRGYGTNAWVPRAAKTDA